MSEDKDVKPGQTKNEKPRSIPVAILNFRMPTDVVGKKQASAVSAKVEGNRAHWVIEYEPWWRHHRVTYKRPQMPDEVCYVHESHVSSWWPVAS